MTRLRAVHLGITIGLVVLVVLLVVLFTPRHLVERGHGYVVPRGHAVMVKP